MAGRLQNELQQSRPFESPVAEVFLNIRRTAFILSGGVLKPLKAEGLSGEQYNVLRILRGAGAGGLSCQEIVSRMVSVDPDMTRLLDKLTTRGLVERERSTTDRRVVITRLSRKGADVLKALEQPMREAADGMLGHLSATECTTLIRLLEKARSAEGVE